MAKEKKHKRRCSYSLFLIPEDHRRIHKVHIAQKHIALMVGAGLATFLFLVFNVVGFWYYRSVNVSLLAEKASFDEFQGEKVELVKRMQQLEDTVSQTEKYAVQLSSLVNTATPSLAKGIGPIPSLPDEAFSVPDHTAPVSLNGMKPKIEDLQERAKGLQNKIQELYRVQKDHVSFVASTPSIWPVKGWVTSDFGHRRSPFGYSNEFHKGMDIASQSGTPVVASADGVVTLANYKGGYGQSVIINHGFGVNTLYGHNSSILVHEGQRIKKGTPIALVGSTGHSTGPHCHFEVHVDGVPVDPMRFLMNEAPLVASARHLKYRR